LNLFSCLDNKALTDNKGFRELQEHQKPQEIQGGSANLLQKWAAPKSEVRQSAECGPAAFAAYNFR
jgi:hypothetical protein